MKNLINYKSFLVLLVLNIISIICVFPYVITLQGDVLEKAGIPLPTLFITQLIQNTILFSIAIFLGLLLAKNTNFKLPLIDAIVNKENYKKVLSHFWKQSVFWGIGTAVTIYLLDYVFTLLGAGLSTHQNLAPVWQKLLAAFYGGVTEETLMRLFLMNLFIWLGMKMLKIRNPSSQIVWVSIILASIIFGIGHLPITSALTKLTLIVVIRAIVLNGIGGVVFGWLYFRKGLESAIIAHFTTDIFLLTLLPLIFS